MIIVSIWNSVSNPVITVPYTNIVKTKLDQFCKNQRIKIKIA